MNIYRWAWMMLIILKAAWQIAYFGPMVQTVSFWACATIAIVATNILHDHLLWAGLHATHLLFHAVGERITS